MASIRKIEGKHGTAYKITVTLGRDALDRQIRHYKTWKPDKPMPARELNRELQRVATEFEQDLMSGFQADNRQTFAEYAAYCYTIREQRGDKPQTLARVRRQTARINEYIGQIPIQEIRPKHLTELYKKFSEPGACRWQVYALPAVDFNQLIPEGETCNSFARSCGVYGNLMRRLCKNQPISRQNAAIIEKNLGRKDLFKPTGDEKPLSSGTIRDYHAIISTVLEQAYKEMIIKYNPAKRATLPKKKRVRESKSLQPEQLKAVLAALEGEGIRAERKSVYDDLDTLRDYGMEIRKVSDKTLIGASPSNIRHFVELRGIGIINARRIFGMGAVKNTEKIDMVIQLEAWDSTKAYDRLGLDNEYTRILDIQVPVITVPITPGRNLAVIVETAAMNNRQKKMGYNAAKELMAGLGMEEIEPEDKELEIWKNS